MNNRLLCCSCCSCRHALYALSKTTTLSYSTCTHCNIATHFISTDLQYALPHSHIIITVASYTSYMILFTAW